MGEDVKDVVIQKTQKLLGKHILKPSLTPKLLNKPPFRFLHDIVTAVIRDTGFLKGVFADHELISENIKERDAKVAFLTKLIEAISAITGNELDVKPSKIVAGLEATKTNKLLQILGTALDKKLDSSEYVSRTRNKQENPKSKVLKKTSSVEKSSKGSKTELPKGSKTELDSTRRESKLRKETREKREKESVREKRDNPKDKKRIKEKRETENSDRKVQNKLVEDVPNKIVEKADVNDDTGKTNNAEKNESRIQEEENVTENIVNLPVEDVPAKVEKAEEKEIKRVGTSSAKIRPKSARIQVDHVRKAEINETRSKEIPAEQITNFLRPPSARPASARPGAPRLRADSTLPTNEVVPLGNVNVIVENFNKDDEEETVVIQNAEIELEPKTVEDVLNIPQDKGHLVEQILEQINDVDDYTQIKNIKNIDESHVRDVTYRDINQLQGLVQSLTKVANPLGKIMNYLHEDIDGMHFELNMWLNAKRQAQVEIRAQRKEQDDSNTALKRQLTEIEENIRKIESEIGFVQSNILRNDLRIKQLLTR